MIRKSNFIKHLFSFISPSNLAIRYKFPLKQEEIVVLLPTYKPRVNVVDLLLFLRKNYPKVFIVVIDDFTPLNYQNLRTLKKIKEMAMADRRIRYLRSSENVLKSGALNLGINYLLSLKRKFRVVFTLDDDIRINEKTILIMAEVLYFGERIGAVCSRALVSNKNFNLLTRLQALEYHNFNVSKIADNGFLKGPLVMQGMLTAFRMSALRSVKGFKIGHLIEDYEITVRLKNKGWKVKIADKACAWTKVPENFACLWKQRVRWNLGGLKVIKNFWKNITAVFQDLIGHLLFISLFILIILSLVFRGNSFYNNSELGRTLLLISLTNFALAYGFSLLSMFTFTNRDWKDWLIKASIILEFFYSNVLTLILLGSYLFLVYNYLAKKLFLKNNYGIMVYEWGLSIFKKIGFSLSWGTK